MQEGKLSVEGLLTHRFPLNDCRLAFAVAADKAKHRSIKVALDVGAQEVGTGYREAGFPDK